MPSREPSEAHRVAEPLPNAGPAEKSIRLIGLFVIGASLFTFVTAFPRIFRQIPAIAARRSQDWESLRAENHGFYRVLIPAINAVKEKVPPHGVVILENYHVLNQLFLGNYLAPRRVFMANVPELKQRNFDPASTWVLTLGPVVEDRQQFQLTPWNASRPPERK